MSARASWCLRDRRRLRRRRLVILFFTFLLLLLAGAIYALWQPGLRVSQVKVFGADQSFVDYAHEAMRGAYFGIVPRDSTFFLPTRRIRSNITLAHPDIAALSIFRRGFTGLSIRVVGRTAVGRWCGLAPTEGVTPYCYLFDPSGFVYMAVPEADASSTPAAPATLNPFELYAPLVDLPAQAGDTLEPLRATISRANQLPEAFNLARQIATFGSKATAVVIHDDEADILLASGTRVTYVLGHEQDAFNALTSARANINLTNSSLDYVDLRFDGKVYTKKKGE